MWLIIFLIWLAIAAWLSEKILSKIFPASWINWVLAVFLPLFFLGPIANIFTAWFKLTEKSFLFCLALILAVLGALAYRFAKEPSVKIEAETAKENSLPIWLWVVFHLLLVLSAFFIFKSVSGSNLTGPWQVLPIWYLLSTGAAGAIIFYGILKGERTIRLLISIILFSLLVHGYLLVYSNGFGGDRFRHLGSEVRIMSGLEYQPTLQTNIIWWAKLGPISVPQALIDSSKLSYGTQWSLEVIVSEITGWPVFQINRFLLPLLWATILPLLIYLSAGLIKPARNAPHSDAGGSKRKFALLAAQLSSGLYLLQYYGSQGLPAAYGLLWLAFILALLLSYLKRASHPLLGLIILVLLLMYFNYSLCFILALIIFALAWTMKNRPHWTATVAVASAAALMLLDYFSASAFSLTWRSPFDAVLSSNLIYFNAFVHNFGLARFAIDAALIAIIIALIAWSAFNAVKSKNKSWQLVCWIFLIPLAAYLLSTAIFSGDHLLARRLTLFVDLPLVFILAWLIDSYLSKIKPELAAIVLAVAFMLVYYSGPTLDISISNDDLSSAKRMLPSVLANPSACLKLPEPVILSLEYLSAKQFQETINNQNCQK